LETFSCPLNKGNYRKFPSTQQMRSGEAKIQRSICLLNLTKGIYRNVITYHYCLIHKHISKKKVKSIYKDLIKHKELFSKTNQLMKTNKTQF